MKGDTDLERLERQAWRKFYDDGLFDIFLGTMLAMMPVASMIETWLPNELSRMAVLVAVYAGLVLAFTLLRRGIVRPRLGTIKPTRERRRKVHGTTLVLAGSVLLGLLVWAVTALRGAGNTDFVDYIPLVFLLNATVVFAAMAYLLDVPRFYAYGPLFGMSIVVLEYSRTLLDIKIPVFVAFGLPALIIVGVGVYKLVRFLRDYPVRDPGTAIHENG
ncbi:MAG: hypothetical protein OEV43_02555 [Coriobacteriia bacterium]|nr:hypothetical protein [Coriobacteriia bacterium]